MNKPKKCCYPDCFNCIYVDCRYDGIEKADIIMQDKFDKELEIVEPEILRIRERRKRYFSSKKGKEAIERYRKSEKFRENLKRYNNSDKGINRIKEYLRSEKGKETIDRYLRSEKGKEMSKRKQMKKIESGKNAEYCRRYRQKLKERKMIE